MDVEPLSPSGRSTKGASKQRRDLINQEIDSLKDILPLPETVRQRLFQLQVMSLACIFIRKERYLPYIFGATPPTPVATCSSYDFSKTLKGFLCLITRQGKLIYLSENASDYLGHSVEEIMSQGDSFYDIVDPRDLATVQSELLSGPPSMNLGFGVTDEKVFLCRLSLSRVARRQPQYQKFVMVRGRYLHPAEYYQALLNVSGSGPFLHPVFAALCCPLATPETVEVLASGSTWIFSSVHNLDMKFVQIDEIGEYHMGYPKGYLKGQSWYALLHPSDLAEASLKHKQLCDDKDGSCILLIRLRNLTGEWLWLHTVLSLREGMQDESVQQLIMATYQMLGDIEASTLQLNRWIYNHQPTYKTNERPYPMVRSKSEDLMTKPIEELTESDWSQYEPQETNFRPKRRYSRTPKDPNKQFRPLQTPLLPDHHRHSYSEEPINLSPEGQRLQAARLAYHQSPKMFRCGSAMSSADPREIRVDIPPYSQFPIPSMLTPDSSPDSRKSFEPLVRPIPDPPALTRPVDETLPEIEPSSLEDYLRTVESDEHLSLAKKLRRVQSQPSVEMLTWDCNVAQKSDSGRSDASESSGADSPSPERHYFGGQNVPIPVFTQVRSHFDTEQFIAAHQYQKGNFRRMSRTLANIVPF